MPDEKNDATAQETSSEADAAPAPKTDAAPAPETEVQETDTASAPETETTQEADAASASLPGFATILGLGATLVTLFALIYSFSLHLARSTATGYPFLLASFSVNDIVAILPQSIFYLAGLSVVMLFVVKGYNDLKSIILYDTETIIKYNKRCLRALAFALAWVLAHVSLLFINNSMFSDIVFIIDMSLLLAASALIPYSLYKKGNNSFLECLARFFKLKFTGFSCLLFSLVRIALSICLIAISYFIITIEAPVKAIAIPIIILITIVILIALAFRYSVLSVFVKKDKTQQINLIITISTVFLFTALLLPLSPINDGFNLNKEYILFDSSSTQYILLDIFANGNAVIQNEHGSYQLIALADGYSICTNEDVPPVQDNESAD